MNKFKIALLSGAAVTVGVIAAVAATGPHGEHGRWGGRSLTADQYDTRTREQFARMDKNSDGVIDKAEIEASLKDRIGRGSGQRHGWREGRGAGGAMGSDDGQRVAQFLKQFGDKDGKVTKDAFLTEAKRRFTQMDLNNDGKITDDDLPPMLRGKGILKANSPATGRMDRMLDELRAAASPDGVVTMDAFLAAATKRFDGLDRNKDGIVDKADFDVLRAEMVDYGVKRFLHSYGADADGKVTRDQFFKVAKERFARLDRRGEGKIEFGPPEGGSPRGRWFGRDRGPDRGGRPEDQEHGGPPGPPAAPRN